MPTPENPIPTPVSPPPPDFSCPKPDTLEPCARLRQEVTA